jgi:3-hydroxyisobutyrate dehydrogenase-like beta-hydroxyacid dehydrogenase
MGSGGKIGFIGLGVMGEPMCRNIAGKSGRQVRGFDIDPKPLERLAVHKVEAAKSLSDVARDCETICVALPSGKHLDRVCRGPDGLLAAIGKDQVVVDFGTSPVDLTREIAAAFVAKGARYADAPIARTRQAAEDGTLAIMVGADTDLFEELTPLLACVATDITRCGGIGTGQIVKIMNNMVVAQTVVALSEALATARRAGLDGGVLFDALNKGSADSFVLRNHGMKALLPGVFPERAFSVEYMLKDLSYALALAADAGVSMPGAELADRLLKEAAAQGYGGHYFPVVSKVIDTAR